MIEPLEKYRPKSFQAVIEAASENEEAVVVHGWQPFAGGWARHAWVEAGEAVYDLTVSRSPLDKTEYHEARGVREELLVRYARVEFFTRMAEAGHIGPFDEDLFFAETSERDPLPVIRERRA